MFKKILPCVALVGMAMPSLGATENTPINGTVESRCIIQTDTPGTYGNPNAYTLSTDLQDGGEPAIIRIDVSLADAYYAEITPPSEFSSSPTLPDVVTWDGDVAVDAVSDATTMGGYETGKIVIGETHKYDLTATGSTWFEVSSEAELGGNRAYPGGNYTALVVAQCIAQ